MTVAQAFSLCFCSKANERQPAKTLYMSLGRQCLMPLAGIVRTVSFLAGANAGVCKPTPHHIKLKLIKARLRQLPSPILVETGTYLGDTVAALKPYCSRIV